MSRSAGLLILLVGLGFCATAASGGEIHRAVEAGDVALVRRILADDPSALFQLDESRFREPPLVIAAATGNVEMARTLLDAGAQIDVGDCDNSTALGVAALRRNAEMVAFLIERGADVNRRDRKADCPLSFAVNGGDEAIIQQLLDAGADLYFRNPNGETLLHLACARNLLGFVRHLLDNGMDLEARSANLGTPLCYAALQGHVEMVKLLLERGAKLNPGNPEHTSPLLCTVWRNRIDCARVLIENGAKIDLPAFNNNTALMLAAENSTPDMINLLIEHGADVNHKNDSGETPLIHAVTLGSADRVEPLLAAGADPNTGADGAGRSALQMAAIGGYTEVARQLLDAGADPKARTPAGDTPLKLASYYGHEDVAEMLAARAAGQGSYKPVDRSLSALGDVGKKEAVIWFLGHSGWAVKTTDHLLIFDYFPQGESPTAPGLCNGHVSPAEIAGEKVAVFASHEHADHYNPAIFEWREQVPDITYFLGTQPADVPPYEFMPARMEKSFGDIKLVTIGATDAGVGMVVQVDGLTIFHGGDHANGRAGLMDEFTEEIDYLADRGIRPDICFMGITGCSLGTPDEVKEGVYYTLRTLKPRVFIPMHAGTQGQIYREFIAECSGQFESVRMAAADNRGDHLVYKKGKIEDPKAASYHKASMEGGSR